MRGAFEHNDKVVLYDIRHDRDKPRGKDKILVLHLENFLIRSNSLHIPFKGFDKDFKTEESIFALIDRHIKKIEKWMNAPKIPEKSVFIDFNSKTYLEDFINVAMNQ